MEAHLDDEWGDKAQSLRTLGRVRPGLFVSYLSFQWFMKKLPNATSKPPARDSHLRDMPRAGFVCWSDTFKKEDCCDEARFGAGGNAGCWDMVYTFRRCCK
ncbi:unnamed protein product [Effrenium voratum]|uniref:Uncharacterized protein n=1 Tax=Effrenium voratum TaxID=2562239 RepID=A0AA36IC19_9DINO|nr:unnamed protein product [Effrenium voratum]CAJ1420140.1 unnamed protein product [Effrenium voratum]